MSNVQHLALFVFLIFLPMVISRDCYDCLSVHSFKDCDDNRRKVYCLTSTDCAKVKVYTSSGVGYGKGCAKTCSASEVPNCNEPGVKCEINCCSSDYCNGASGPVVNGILLIATFTATFMHLFNQ